MELLWVSARIKSLIVFQCLLLNFRKEDFVRRRYCTQERNPFVKRVTMSASLCLPHWGSNGVMTNFGHSTEIFFNSRLFSRPSVKIWQFLRLRAKCLAVLRRSVNLIENYFVCIKNREVTGA